VESKTTSEMEFLVQNIIYEFGDRIKLVPIGNRENNRGVIEIGKDPGRGIVERITNAINTVLELEYIRHRGIPECRTPREAARAWLDVPPHGLYELSPSQRRELAESVVVTIEEGDDQLKIINEEAKSLTLKKKDEETEKIMRSEVARILRFYGFESTETLGGTIREKIETDDRTQPVRKHKPHKPTKIIEIHDPPIYVKILAESPIEFHPEQRRYVRIETDAHSTYHNAEDIKRSRVSIIINGEEIHLSGTTPLKSGRMRIILDCLDNAVLGSKGVLSIEISRPGLPAISDNSSYLIVEKPKTTLEDKKVSIPPIECKPVEGPDDQTWITLDWPEDIKKSPLLRSLERIN
jgi:hypothetical protein